MRTVLINFGVYINRIQNFWGVWDSTTYVAVNPIALLHNVLWNMQIAGQ